MYGGAGGHNIERNHPRTIPAKFALIWFSCFREEDLNVIFYQNMPNLHNLYKLAERKLPQKISNYMQNYSLQYVAAVKI